MARPKSIQLGDGTEIPILYEDRAVLAIDKPAGWMLVPFNWDKTSRNLQLAISSGIDRGAFWARSRNLRFLKYVHRLDAETTGVLLFAKSQGALKTFSELFESRSMHKRYLAAVRGEPKEAEWTCTAKLGPDELEHGRHRVDPRGKDATTMFRVLERRNGVTLIEARPVTGRTHQIRLHLQHAGLPIIGDPMYGTAEDRSRRSPLMGLRAVGLEYQDPFTHRRVRITARSEDFVKQFLGDAPDPGAAEPIRSA